MKNIYLSIVLLTLTTGSAADDSASLIKSSKKNKVKDLMEVSCAAPDSGDTPILTHTTAGEFDKPGDLVALYNLAKPELTNNNSCAASVSGTLQMCQKYNTGRDSGKVDVDLTSRRTVSLMCNGVSVAETTIRAYWTAKQVSDVGRSCVTRDFTFPGYQLPTEDCFLEIEYGDGEGNGKNQDIGACLQVFCSS